MMWTIYIAVLCAYGVICYVIGRALDRVSRRIKAKTAKASEERLKERDLAERDLIERIKNATTATK